MSRLACLITLVAAFLSAVVPLEVLGCTSWMVFSDFTGNGSNILHKNRNFASRKVFISSNQPGAARRWIALGSGGADIGFNSSGLAGAMNGGEKCIDPPAVKGRKSTPKMLQVILESCDTAAAAVEKLRIFVHTGSFSKMNCCKSVNRIFPTPLAEIFSNACKTAKMSWKNGTLCVLKIIAKPLWNTTKQQKLR